MPRPIINIADLEYREWGHGGSSPPGAGQPDEKFKARLGAIGSRIGAQKLGYNLTVVPPGKRAFPRHSHHVNEEMFFIVEGSGEVRIGDERYAIKAGDVIACPPGGPETAHHIINTSDAELKFLAVSTMLSPEIAEYPDSGKFGLLTNTLRDADGKPKMQRFIGRWEDNGNYWDGE